MNTKTNILTFIKKLILISFPIILQQLFLNLASLLDTLMVGQLDDISISGVYIATQIVFVTNLMLLGATEGASVFFSQFFGCKDEKRMKNSFVLKLIFSVFIGFIELLILTIFGKNLIGLFLNESNKIEIAWSYLLIVSFSMIPYAISVSISTTLREYHKPIMPMIITFIGVIFNFIFNYLLIFGKFGFPNLGATGAAIGTLINRIIEVILLIIYILIKKFPFSRNIKEGFKIEKELLKKITLKSIPLFFNETLWSFSQTILVFFFTKCDSIATTVLPIVQTIFNLLFVVSLGLSNGISIIVGNTVGSNDFKKAQKQAYGSLLFVLTCCFILGIILFFTSDLIVSLYTGVDAQTKELASYFIKFNSIYLMINGLNTCLFYLLRAGGKTEVVFFFDSFYGWIISIPFAIIIVTFIKLPLKQMYISVYLIDLIKTIIGIILIITKKWYKNLTLDMNKEIEIKK